MSYQREFTNRLRVAMIGIGSHAYRNLLPALTFLPVQLVAVCNRSHKEIADITAAQYGCKSYQSSQEMYEKERLDAVLISASPEAHPGLILEALAAGLHVWVEKPAAMFSQDIEKMLEKKGDRVVMVGYKKAFMPATHKAVEIINSPQYGGLESIMAVYPVKMPADGKKVLQNKERTDWLNNGCHPLSVLMETGGPVDRVVSMTGPMGNGVNLLQFKNGVMGTLFLASGPQPVEDYHFYASKWHLQIENSCKVILERGIPSVYGRTTSFAPEGDDTGALVWQAQNCKSTLENQSAFIQGIYNELMDFCSCILEGKEPTTGSLNFALQLGKIYEALLISQGKWVAID